MISQPLTTKIERLIRGIVRPGRVSVLGLTGQSGSGKTRIVTPAIISLARHIGLEAVRLGLDTFFRLSSSDRAAWLTEGERMGPQEAARRRDESTWWNFSFAEESLATLRRGEPLHLSGVYNRTDGGKLTGTVEITPPPEGMLVIFEGVGVAHLDGLDRVVYVHAAPEDRLSNLIQRDQHRTISENIERFRLNEEFERRYFRRHLSRVDLFIRIVSSDGRIEVVNRREVAISLASKANFDQGCTNGSLVWTDRP